MSAKDAILGHVCVERGWMSEPVLEDCLKECATLSRSRPAPESETFLPRVLLRRHLIPEMELEALREEIAKVLRRDAASAPDGTQDLRLLKLLLRSARVSKEHVDQAMAEQRELLGKGKSARVIELLLEKGQLTLTALEEAFQGLRRAATSVTCGSCRAVYSIFDYDPGRIYLCKACTGELAPAGAPAPASAPVAAPTPASSASSAVLPSVGEEGARIGRFRSLKEIGRGGMGRVYKAWDDVHQRWVALKVISDRQPLEGLTRFRREVEISKSLHHPNIVAVYEVSSAEGKHLISMQYVDGVTLEAERWPPGKAATLVVTIAHALQYAHSHGVIHRDIKPQNLMVDRAGKPYLMDFGMAKSLDNPSCVTAVGIAMGTPSFMSPEQALGRTSRVDRRSDVYSLGAVLYALVTGRPPFRGSSPIDTIQKVSSEEAIPPSQVVSGVPAALEAVILRCLLKERNDRYQTAKQLAEELERILPQMSP
ncbi:MAG TPA: serine/threonine-protein kinase [Planctomycetota bacterium]|nr:serine/threonine-protein kinase [Planctomycetota bacterium]